MTPDQLLRGSVAEYVAAKRAGMTMREYFDAQALKAIGIEPHEFEAMAERGAQALNPLVFEGDDSPTKQSMRDACRASSMTVLAAALIIQDQWCQACGSPLWGGSCPTCNCLGDEDDRS